MSWKHAVICCEEGRSWELTTHQWATLLYLAMMANMETAECRPTMGAIAEATKQSKKSARAKVAELERLGYLKVTRKAGNGGRNTYKVLVDKFLKGERGDPFRGDGGEKSKGNATTPLNAQRGTPRPLKGERDDPLKGNVATPLGGTIGGVQRLKAKRLLLLGIEPSGKEVVNNVDNPEDNSGQNHSAEEVLATHGKKAGKVAPSARKELKRIYDSMRDRRSDEEYENLMKTPGWVPMTRADRIRVQMRCQELGASFAESQEFVRRNAIRKWTVCETASIEDAIVLWVRRWRRESPDEWRAEQARRQHEAASRIID